MPVPHGDRGENPPPRTNCKFSRPSEISLQGVGFLCQMKNVKYTSHYVGASRLRVFLIFRTVPDVQFKVLVDLVPCRGWDMLLLSFILHK